MLFFFFWRFSREITFSALVQPDIQLLYVDKNSVYIYSDFHLLKMHKILQLTIKRRMMIKWVIQNKIIKRSIYAIEIIRFIIKNESWKFRIKIKYCQIFFSNITLQHFLRFFIYTFPCIFYSWLCNLCSADGIAYSGISQ